MNKTQLIDAVAERLGDRRSAAAAVDGMLDTIVATVAAGESVTITGFGVFEGRARAARVARNPRTGAAVDVPAATVPAFRPGAGFRSVVSGAAPARRAAPRPVVARPEPVAPAPEPTPSTRKPKPAGKAKVKAATAFTLEEATRPGKSGKATSAGKNPKAKAKKK